MATLVWTAFATIFMLGILAGCIVVVTAGTRYFEEALAKRRAKPGA